MPFNDEGHHLRIGNTAIRKWARMLTTMGMLRIAVASLLQACVALAMVETPDQVAYRARALLVDPQTYGVGTFSTTYQHDHPTKSLRGAVASGPEYFAACANDGNLLMLAMPVSQNWRNALEADGHNATMSIMSSADPRVPDPRHTASHNPAAWDPKRPSWRRGMPSKQRLTLMGHIERVPANDSSVPTLRDCYLRVHPDARHWMPGSDESPHMAFWVHFIVDAVYRVGGFGDESAIGWVDMDKYRSGSKATYSEWDQADRTWQGEGEMLRDGAQDKAASSVLLFRENAERANPMLRFQA